MCFTLLRTLLHTFISSREELQQKKFVYKDEYWSKYIMYNECGTAVTSKTQNSSENVFLESSVFCYGFFFINKAGLVFECLSFSFSIFD